MTAEANSGPVVGRTGSRVVGRIVVVPDRKPDTPDQLRQGTPRRPRISTARLESTVDQLVDWRMEKKQHMRWTRRGAQMLPPRALCAAQRRTGQTHPMVALRITAKVQWFTVFKSWSPWECSLRFKYTATPDHRSSNEEYVGHGDGQNNAPGRDRAAGDPDYK
jgi:hypothetical protein